MVGSGLVFLELNDASELRGDAEKREEAVGDSASLDLQRLAAEAAAFVRGLRGLELAKPPGVAETIDWAHALAALGRQELDAEVVEQTLGSVLKYREDIVVGLDNAPEAFIGLLQGKNFGKLLVRVSEDPMGAR